MKFIHPVSTIHNHSEVRVSAKPSKMSEVTFKNYSDIDETLVELKRDLVRFRIKRATRQEFKPSDIRSCKHRIAALLTVRREKQIAEGIGYDKPTWVKKLK